MVFNQQGSPDPPHPFLEMRGIGKKFEATVALDDVSLVIRKGEVVALVGENGAGKSTLMKILSGVFPPDAGAMFLDGQPYHPRNPHEARSRGVAMIYQELSLALHLSVAENILLGMEPLRGPFIRHPEMMRRAREALTRLGHGDLDPLLRADRLPIALRQVVEIARAVAVGCRLLVLDEPTSSLTRDDVTRLFSLVRTLREQGHAIIYISHQLEEVKEISDRFVVLRDGKNAGEGFTAATPSSSVVSMMVGREVSDLYTHSPRIPGEILLHVENLGGRSKPIHATVTLRRGEVIGIAGLVGAGRTEFLRAVFGLDPVRQGVVRVGTYVGPASPARRWRQGVGMVSEDRNSEGLSAPSSLADNITLPRLERFGRGGLVSPRRLRARSQHWIEELRIKCEGPRQRVADLSGGNQQKVAIARLLEADVDVLLLDEPTRGIDIGAKAEIYRWIDRLSAQGKGIIMVSSYLPELLGVCDRVAVMCRGTLNDARPAAEVTGHSLMLEALGGA